MLKDLAENNNSCTETQVGFSAGKQYNIYVTRHTDSQQALSLNSFRITSRCDQSKIIIELDGKEVNNFGCNTKGKHYYIIDTIN